MAKEPSGKEINALSQHIRNLLTPSTPLFFNTLYDPFANGADFVHVYHNQSISVVNLLGLSNDI